ncbi:4-hydroxyphenylpyruvate dioxygenase [Streptomyces sp. NPDC051569]|uniref:4-hydroxyphenylpyruvate dioxygenase n=1 Tax=Streptomyces sp. NPDC051569 TaxID=3365661 RepID=UPI0037942152
MNTTADTLRVSHVEIYTADARAAAADFVNSYGFQIFATAERGGPQGASRSVALRQGDIVLVMTEAIDEAHPAAAFVARHGDGIGDIALSTPDTRAAFHAAVELSAVPLAGPVERDGYVTAVLAAGFDDVRHTLVQRPADRAGDLGPLPGFVQVADLGPAPAGMPALTVLDHVAVTVRPGELGKSTAYYEEVFGYHGVYEELMVQGTEAMDSKAVRSPAGDLTFTVLAPDPAYDAGHIGDFLERHGSGGVHHLAFATEDIVTSVADLRERGIEFLKTPATYYDRLRTRLDLDRHSIDELQADGILADEDHAGQLYQIFTRTKHPKRTLFFEVIERIGADTFGGGNVKALYEAVQAERDETQESAQESAESGR